jgi:succinoglycan biosynthesis transport protein ExoP
MSFNQFMIVLKARWKIAAGVFFTVIALVITISLVLPKKYTATAAVVIDVKSPDPIAGMVLPGMMTPGYLATQMDIIASERVARGVVKQLHMDEDSSTREKWKEDTNGEGSFEAWLAAAIQGGLEIKPAKESSVINISYSSPDPKFSAALANAFVKNYIDTTLELRIEPAKQFKMLFEVQANQARERLEQAQTRLSSFQREKGLIATDERLDIETSRLNELSAQLVTMQSLAAESLSRKTQVSANSPEVLNSAVIASLKTQQATQEARLKEISSRFGDSYPQIKELQANIAEIKIKIDAETSRITSSVGINNAVAQAREAQLRADLEAQRQRVLQFKQQRDEAAVLQRDVENAERAFEAITNRLNISGIESQSNQTNVSVVKQASPPTAASSPRFALNVILGVIVGSFLAIGLALLAELKNSLLRTGQEIPDTLGLVLLGNIPVASAAAAPTLLSGKRLLNLGSIKKAPKLPAP